ncbi:hypothetical protein CkaCkLH20_01877 [Colletotrichum karsti]|uniref:NAD(P)-binding protein n=1 Tax=Colletotrichum karsti TaxID=1095194 RepID=A0A9P6IDV8_9PEZI|nr:uncharacterized protein CkaCkLH20_01877 [Colletotrichum karsti]KAF9880835.1 hypothetical protein CkaCkLH20_01877 [Colletotrichum karsti]
MPSIHEVRRSNALLKSGSPGMVAVMAGATSGIGQATCKALVEHCEEPTVYIVGRNIASATATMEHLKTLNPSAKIHFIQSDLSLLNNVDAVCREIMEKETKINLVFLSAGFLSMNGRDETKEGLDKMFSLQYYSRIRFILNLLPGLERAGRYDELARVVSVLGAGKEGNIFSDDLSLTQKANYSLPNCARQSITMTSLSFEHLAKAHPTVSFLHVSPGTVRGTNIMTGMGSITSSIINALMVIAAPFNVSVKESGQRHLYAATSASLTKKTKEHAAYRLAWDGEACRSNEVFEQYMKDGTCEKVWTHTEAEFKNICKH